MHSISWNVILHKPRKACREEQSSLMVLFVSYEKMKCTLTVFSVNIRLGLKCKIVRNTLAYCARETVKSFKLPAPAEN